MITNWLANLPNLDKVIYDLFLLPGTFVLSQIGAHAPELALKLGISAEGNGVMLTAFASLLVWSLSITLVSKAVKAVSARIFYGIRNLRTLLICKVQELKRRRLLRDPIPIPDVELNDLDIAVLNFGMTLSPGLALTEAEQSGELTQSPEHVQHSLDKLRKHGLVDGTTGTTEGFDNYCLTRSGAYLLTMWQQNSNTVHPTKTTPIIR